MLVRWPSNILNKAINFLPVIIILILWYLNILKNLKNYQKNDKNTTRNQIIPDLKKINIFVPSRFEDTTNDFSKINKNETSNNTENLHINNIIHHHHFFSQKKDWHNYKQIKNEKFRVGICEQGKPCSIPKQEYTEQMKNLYNLNGYNVPLGDRIPLNRSLPDFRHSDCKKRLYLKSLPEVSIVVPYHNEHLSTLLRSAFSIFYRSPEHLIKEIFLVDDASTREDLKDKLNDYIREHMPKVKIIRLTPRDGLVAARLAGARAATADVLVFLDAHIEANVNWLPPLLEPIALDYKTVVLPLIDVIDFGNFEYRQMDLGKRGLTEWLLGYSRLPLPPHIHEKLPEPFETPVMMGGLFAISRRFFWELGGYDPELKIWGGEQYELSFKIWMCGGRILEAPCSHVGHLYRDFSPNMPDPEENNYKDKNIVRVAKVWLDDYIKYLYARKPHYRQIDPGDLTPQIELRKKLKCKPFKWFLSQIMYDLLQQFPLDIPKPYASGRIHPHKNPMLCIDANDMREYSVILLQPCVPINDKMHPLRNSQYYDLTWFNDVKLNLPNLCWDLHIIEAQPGMRIVQNTCHRDGGNQQWRYYEVTKHFEHYSGYCLDYEPASPDLFINICDDESETQMWNIDIVHAEQLAKWNESHTIRVTAPEEKWNE